MLRLKHIIGLLICVILIIPAINTKIDGTVKIKMKKTSHPLGTKNPVIPDGVPTNIIHTKMIKPKKAPNQRLIAPIPKDIGEYKWFNPKHMVPVQIESMDKLYSKYSIGSKLGFVMMVFFAVVFYAGFCILYITHMV